MCMCVCVGVCTCVCVCTQGAGSSAVKVDFGGGSFYAVTCRLSHSYPTVVLQLSYSCPTRVLQLSYTRPTVVLQLSYTRVQTGSILSPLCSRHTASVHPACGSLWLIISQCSTTRPEIIPSRGNKLCPTCVCLELFYAISYCHQILSSFYIVAATIFCAKEILYIKVRLGFVIYLIYLV